MEQLEKKELKSFVDTLEFLYELVVDESDHDFPRDNPEVKRFIETYSLSEGSALSLAMLMHSYPNSLSRHAINTVIEAIGEDPFFVIATQNPVETLGTYPLPEAQLDRFLMQISMGMMSEEEELAMIDRFIAADPLESLGACCSRDEILSVRKRCRTVFIHPDLRRYVTRLIHNTRGGAGTQPGTSSYAAGSSDTQPGASSYAQNGSAQAGLFPGRTARIEEGVSPRGTLALVRASQGFALLRGRDYVTPEDIQAAAIPCLAHRCLMAGMASAREKEERILSALTRTEVPTEDWKR